MPAAPQPLQARCERSAADRFVATPRWDAIPGFAPSRCFRQRVLLSMERLIALHPGRRIAVVTHASVINAYLSALLDVPRDTFFAPEHASICCVRSLGELHAVRSLNDTAHLLGEQTARPGARTAH